LLVAGTIGRCSAAAYLVGIPIEPVRAKSLVPNMA
jgi:hypothetical protein